ncbi:GlsB/YeaQ/YmgE family stress response membrane protein [bacterium]|nr:GlsB/YeaQ/YmgE family stress response membrane protein [bacterium]
MGILSWILFGLIAGALGKWIMPGDDPGGIIVTILIGILGAVVGGFIGSLIGFGGISGFDFRSLIIAIVGALLCLFIYRKLKTR